MLMVSQVKQFGHAMPWVVRIYIYKLIHFDETENVIKQMNIEYSNGIHNPRKFTEQSFIDTLLG